MKSFIRPLIVFIFLLCFSSVKAQDYWQFPSDAQKRGTNISSKKGIKSIYLDVNALRKEIAPAGRGSKNTKNTLYFPNETDVLEPFQLKETNVIASNVAKWAPDIKTYRGVSLQREGVSIRVTISSRGVNYIMRNGNAFMFMEYQKDSNEHIYYERNEIDRNPLDMLSCESLNIDGAAVVEKKKSKNDPAIAARVTSDQILRTYRVAVAGTATYTAHWGSQSDAYNAVVNTINRVNEVFETDFGVTLSLVSTSSLMKNDPTVNEFNVGDNSGAGETTNVLHGSMDVISSTLDVNDYDVGHTFHKISLSEYNAGYSSSFGLRPSVCSNNDWNGKGPAKAGGISRSFLSGTTDSYDIDYVAHELGHQFNAEHTFSYQTSPNSKSAEPGSGSTIMAYAGVASPSNVQGNSDPYFHYLTIDQVNTYITTVATCNVTSSIVNVVPTVNAGSDVAIPQGTAYFLNANATDSDANVYFCWEQLDTGMQIIQSNFGPTQTSGPMARSLVPTTTNVRVIPNMDRVVAGELTKTNPTNDTSFPAASDDWETVATVSRTLTWGVTVRDRSNASVSQDGQLAQDDLTITVVPTSTPFSITSQSGAGVVWNGGSNVTVNWDVAQTNSAPINVSNVTLLLSTDGGYTYPTTLVSSTANNGSATFAVPNGITSSNCRVKVEPIGNIFFAINSRNFQVNSTNTPPTTAADYINVFENGTATTTTNNATSLLSNDSDADGDSLSTVLVSGVTNGTLTLAPSGTGSFTYVHDGSETTTDSFTYRAYDGTSNGNIVTVSISVTPTNDCPIVQNSLSNITAMEDDPDDIVDFSNVFFDAEGAMLTYTVSNTNTTLLSATISGTTIVIDYVDDEVGTATVTLSANDSGCGSITDESFLITVVAQNDPPVAVNDTVSLTEGGTATTTTGGATSVISNDTDTENDPLTVTLLSPPLYHVGSFSLQSSGTFTYVHNNSETTTDSFTYTLADATSTSTATVNITITPENDCPTVVSPTADISATEDDPDVVMDVSPIFDDVDINPMPNSLSYTVTHSNSSLASITLSNATLTIDYLDDQNGSTTVTLTADDNVGCTVDDVFLITVSVVNDSPVSNPNTINVDEGGTATSTTNTLTSVLDNDSDVEGDAIIAIVVATTVNGTLTLQSSGTFEYVHNGSETTTDSFTYKANDGNSDGNTVTVAITINPINDCPSLPAGYTLPVPIVTNEDVNSGIWNLRLELIDDDHPVLTYTSTHTNSALGSLVLNANQPSLYGDIQFTPNADQFGSSTGTITASDGICSYDIPITITVNPVNDCPTVINPIADQTANEDDANLVIDISNTFTDIESSTLNYSVVSDNSSLASYTIAGTNLVIDFEEDQFGTANVVLTTTDGDINCTIDDSFVLTVTGINDAPDTVSETISLLSGATVSTLNDGSTTSVLANDNDVDGDSITAVLVSTTSNGSLTLNSNGTFSYTHDGSSTTSDNFTYYATDSNANGNTVTVQIYINNPPVAVTETIAVFEGGTATTTTAGVTSLLDNDTDAEGDPLTAELVTQPSDGALTLNSDGSFTYIHNGNSNANDSFTYRANDGKISGSPISVTITVTNTNDAPVANNDTIVVAINGTATTLDNGNTSVTDNDTDPEGDSLTVTLVSSPTNGTLTLNPNGTFSYVQGGTAGSDSFTYKVSDGTLDSGNATVDINLSCSPCTESFIEAGANGVSFSYTDCNCKTIRVYVPKGRAYTFCHLDGSINIVSGSYTLLSSGTCN